ncbi:DUF1128 domain-containing protein [Desmospora profundinema]|uniref:Uncharacterized protein YfkK (UPF0435 family) n=1 Tax=Desmospora profundinema TaxID=1571184 RepID=A0ABU1INH1_9BACL|nr:DUF1128 family protein [Desmospora profundinema]MDR6225948.1 uncharacterized protein YfkK (UPF0435 family) [Desmospora profundinema]
MDLNNPSKENLVYMIDAIKNHLKLVNAGLIDPEDYRLDDYEEVKDLYEMVERKKGNLTMMELDGVLAELGELRKPR